MPEAYKIQMQEAQASDRPLFFGHYWQTGATPEVINENAICIDQSVAKGGHLAAASIEVADGKIVSREFTSVENTHFKAASLQRP